MANKTKFQIYCDRGNGLELDGCWGSENARYDTREEADEGAAFLAKVYPECKWVVVGVTKLLMAENNQL